MHIVDCAFLAENVMGFAFPLRESYMVGAFTIAPEGPRQCTPGRLVEVLRKYICSTLGLEANHEFSVGYLPSPDYRKPLSSRNVMLVGDAAGLNDPFFGEGIYFAIRSGTVAAECSLKALSSSDCAVGGYDRAIWKEFGPTFRVLKAACTTTRVFPGFAFRLVTECPQGFAQFIRYADCLAAYGGFLLLPVWFLMHKLSLDKHLGCALGAPVYDVSLHRLG
jgi:flavin-dependent dehydrogenase